MSQFLVIVEHAPEACPLAQSTPEAAETLARNLRSAAAVGVFSMQLHHGVAIVQADAGSEEELGAAFQEVLPNHKTPVVVDVSDDEWWAQFLATPELLDEEPNDGRYAFLARAATYHQVPDLGQSEREARPTLSLRRLPDYLEMNAPGRSA